MACSKHRQGNSSPCQMDESDVDYLSLPECIQLIEQWDLCDEGVINVQDARLLLKLHIIKQNPQRKKSNREPGEILKNIKKINNYKCEKLIQVINSIEMKVEGMKQEGSLWQSLSTVAANYEKDFEDHRKILSESLGKLIVTGETSAGKTSFINCLLGDDFLPEDFFCNTHAICEITYGPERLALVYPADEESDITTINDGENFKELLEEIIQARQNETVKKIEIQLPNTFLQETEVTMIDTPGIGEDVKTDEMVLNHLENAFGFIFVANSANRGGIQFDRLFKLVEKVRSMEFQRECRLSPKSAIFVGNKLDLVPAEERQRLMEYQLRQLACHWPGFTRHQFIPFSAKQASHVLKEGYMTKEFSKLTDVLENVVSVSSENKVAAIFYWATSYLSKIIYILDVHINNKKETLTARHQQFQDAVRRLTALQELTEKNFEDFKVLLQKVIEALMKKLKKHILSRDVINELCSWSASDFSFLQNWRELDKFLQMKLAERIDRIVKEWELKNHLLQRAMDEYVEKLKLSVSDIAEELVNLQKIFANRYCRTEDNSGDFDTWDEKSSNGWFRPFLYSMTTFQKAYFGYAAGMLFPLVAIAAVSASLYFLVVREIRDYIKGYTFEQFLKNPGNLLERYSRALVNDYCNSKAGRGLKAHVTAMLNPWSSFVCDLGSIVKSQIILDKEIINFYLTDKSDISSLVKFYPAAKQTLCLCQKYLRHFQLFHLKRVSGDVSSFKLRDLELRETSDSRICTSFLADIFRANKTTHQSGIGAGGFGAMDEWEEGTSDIIREAARLTLKSLLAISANAMPSIQQSSVEGIKEESDNWINSSSSDSCASASSDARCGGSVEETSPDEQMIYSRDVSAGRSIEKMTVQQVLEEYRTNCTGVSQNEKSAETRESAVTENASVKGFFGGSFKPSCEIKRNDVWDYREGMTVSKVSIRRLKYVVQEKDVFHYLEEEMKYSKHNCPHIMEFHGTCIESPSAIYQMFEPLECNLRQVVDVALWNGQERRGAKNNEDNFLLIKKWLEPVVSGLVYLHSNGMTHPPLSLDTVAVDHKNRVKLTTMMCPKRIFNREKLDSLTTEDLRAYRYLPHEVFSLEKYKSCSDMYAFGLMVWEILTGRVVFDYDFNSRKHIIKDAESFRMLIATSMPVLPISELCLSDSYADHMSCILHGCIAYKPTERTTAQTCYRLLQGDPGPASVFRERL